METEVSASQAGTPLPAAARRGAAGTRGLAQSRLVNRNVNATHGRTSMRLEPEVWDAIREICLRDDIDLGEMIKRVEKAEPHGGRTSAVRVYVLQYFRRAATEEGHRRSDHGSGDELVRFATMRGPAIRLPD